MNKLGQKLPPLNKRRLRKIPPREEDEINIKLTEAYQYCNDWKFQIHRNKLEWINPRSHDEQKSFCVSSNKKIKDNVKTVHWVGNSQLRSLDTDDLF